MDNNPQHVEQGKNMNDEWLKLSADIIDRLSRIDTTLTALSKTVEGNGKPGLVGRVDSLESDRDTKAGATRMKTRVVAAVMSIVLVLLSVSVSLTVSHNNKEDAEKAAQAIYLQKEDSRIGAVELNLAVVMAGLRGPAGVKGRPGAVGPKGDKGAKGHLF